MVSNNSTFYKLISTNVEKNKKRYLFNNYDLTQAVYRQEIIDKRTKKFFKKDKRLNENLVFKNIILSILNFFFPIFKKFLKKKFDVIFVPNNYYQLKILDNYLSKKYKKVGYIEDFKKNFNLKHIKSIKIKKFLFLEKNTRSNFKQFDKLKIFEKILKFYNPKKVYLIEGDATTDAIIGQICKRLEIKCYCLQHGLHPPILYQKYCKFYFKNYFSDFIYLCNSKQTIKILKKKKIIDKYKLIHKDIYKNFFYETKKKKIVFIIPAFDVREGLDKIFFSQLVKVIKNVSVKLENYEIVVRLHPKGIMNDFIKSCIKNYRNIICHESNIFSIRESFQKSEITCIPFGSSTLIEALEYGTLPIVWSISNKFDYTYFKKKKLGFLVKNQQQFENKIIISTKRPNLIKKKVKNNYKFLKKFYS